MSVVPRVETQDFDEGKSLKKVRLQLIRAAKELKPLPTPAELLNRLSDLIADLDDIKEQALLLYHVAQIEQSGLRERLTDIDARLAQGWEPDSESAEALLERLPN
jgi:hypothetical protein